MFYLQSKACVSDIVKSALVRFQNDLMHTTLWHDLWMTSDIVDRWPIITNLLISTQKSKQPNARVLLFRVNGRGLWTAYIAYTQRDGLSQTQNGDA